MTYNVFISYANTDARTANAICRHLEQQGTKCWIAPRDIEAGVNWAEAIVDVIPKVKVFLLVFSEKSNMSKQVIREVELAIKSEAVIIPVRIENVQPTKSMAYYLSSVQWMNANQPLTDNQLDHIYKTVKKNLEKKPSIRDIEPNKDIVPPPRKRWIWAVLAAAFILLIVAGSAWYFGWFKNSTDETPRTAAKETAAETHQESGIIKVLELNFDSTDDLKWLGTTAEDPLAEINDAGYLSLKKDGPGALQTDMKNGLIFHCRTRHNACAEIVIGEYGISACTLCPIMFSAHDITENGYEKGWTGPLVMDGRVVLNQEQWIDYMLSISEDGSIIYAVASDPADPDAVTYTSYVIPEDKRKAYCRPEMRQYLEQSGQYFYADYAAIVEGPFLDYLKEILPGYDQYETELTAFFSETPKDLPPFSGE